MSEPRPVSLTGAPQPLPAVVKTYKAPTSAKAMGRRIKHNMPKKFLPPPHDFTRSTLLNYLIIPLAAVARAIGLYKPEIAANPQHNRLTQSLNNALNGIPALYSPAAPLQAQMEKLAAAFQKYPGQEDTYKLGTANFSSICSRLEPLIMEINEAREKALQHAEQLEACKSNRAAKKPQKLLCAELFKLTHKTSEYLAELENASRPLVKLNVMLPDEEKIEAGWQEQCMQQISGPLAQLKNVLTLITDSQDIAADQPLPDNPADTSSQRTFPEQFPPSDNQPPPEESTSEASSSVATYKPLDYVVDTTPLTPENLAQQGELTPLTALSNQSTTESVHQNQEILIDSIEKTSNAIAEFEELFNAYTDNHPGQVSQQKKWEFQQEYRQFLQLSSQLRSEADDCKKTTYDLLQSYGEDDSTHPDSRKKLREHAIEGLQKCTQITATYLKHYEAIHESIEELLNELPVKASDELREPFYTEEYETGESQLCTYDNDELINMDPDEWPLLPRLQHNEASARKALPLDTE